MKISTVNPRLFIIGPIGQIIRKKSFFPVWAVSLKIYNRSIWTYYKFWTYYAQNGPIITFLEGLVSGGDDSFASCKVQARSCRSWSFGCCSAVAVRLLRRRRHTPQSTLSLAMCTCARARVDVHSHWYCTRVRAPLAIAVS